MRGAKLSASQRSREGGACAPGGAFSAEGGPSSAAAWAPHTPDPHHLGKQKKRWPAITVCVLKTRLRNEGSWVDKGLAGGCTGLPGARGEGLPRGPGRRVGTWVPRGAHLEPSSPCCFPARHSEPGVGLPGLEKDWGHRWPLKPAVHRAAPRSPHAVFPD